MDDIKDKSRPYIILGIIVTATFFLAFGRYIWGGDYFIFTDAGSDCGDEYYPTYIYLINKIRSGELSLWNHSCGLGFDTLTRQERIMDPFAMLIVGFGVIFGTQAAAPMLVVTHYLKIILSAFLAYKLLGFFEIKREIRVISAYLYGFNSFLIVWGQHYWFGAISVYILVLLIILETWLRNLENTKKYILVYSIAVASCFCYSVYLAYMAVLAVSVYVCIRFFYLSKKNGKELLRDTVVNGCKIIFATLLGMLLASVVVIPFIDNNMMVSSRISTESIGARIIEYLIHPYELIYYFQIILRMISSNVIGINSLGGSYYGLPLLSISIVGIPFMCEGMFKLKENMHDRKEKIIWWSAVGLVFFLIMIPLGSCIFNAFQYPFGRYTIVVLPFFTIVFAFGLERICSEKIMNFYLQGIILLGEIIVLVYSALVFENTDFIRMYIKFVIAMNIIVVFLMGIYTKVRKTLIKILLFSCIILGCVAETYVSSSSNERITMNDLSVKERSRTENTIVVLDNQDKNFYRIDKNYNDFRFLGDSLIEGLHLSTGYNSTLNKYLAMFYENIWPEAMTNGTSKVTTARGYIMDEQNLNNDNILALLGVKYILSDYELENVNDRWKKLEIQENDILVYRNMQANSIVTGFDKIISEKEFEKFSNEDRKEIIKSYLILSEDEMGANKIVASNIDMNALVQAELDNKYSLELVKDTYFKGQVSIDREKYLLVTIPYRRGWNVYVDGKKIEYYRGDYGFIAFSISAGKHVLEVKYVNSIYMVSLLLSLMGIAVWIVLYKTKFLNYLDKR